MIKPSIGRVVWFYRNGIATHVDQQPHAALIAYVHSDRLVNLACFDANGIAYSETSVRLLQEGDDTSQGARAFCTWMPFQIGQAKALAANEEPLKS